MVKYPRFDRYDYERRVLEEVREEASANGHKSLEGLRLVEFTSRSNGKNRKPRANREVSLLVYDTKIYPVVGGEVRSRKDGSSPDAVAQEVLSFLPKEERTIDNLLIHARKKSA